MRYAVAITVAAALTLAGSAASGAGDASRKATLRLASGTPLTVRGLYFAPRERVRLSVSGGQQARRRVTANAVGSFVAQFAFDYDRCNRLVVLAVGSEGSRAGLKRPELKLLCPPRL